MAPYNRRYDYGLRGYDATLFPRQRRRYGQDYGASDPTFRGFQDERRFPRTNRVVARYNTDYIFGGRGEERNRPNPYRHTGDYPGRMVDEYAVGRPYLTHGGTRTSRGQLRPPQYDSPDYGPEYGGRYPDELF